MNRWTRNLLHVCTFTLIGLNSTAEAGYVEGNPLSHADPTGLVPTPRPSPAPLIPRPVEENDTMCLAKNCAQIRASCRASCSETALPTRDFGMTFFRCVNACVMKNGC